VTEAQDGRLFLGAEVDAATHERSGDEIRIKASDLTTHGVIVGMTGSGKTGLGVVLLEEAIAAGIPCLVIDPKGDMGNLLLNFPALDGDSFEPWVQADQDPEETATMWREGLASWGIDGKQMQELKDSADFTIYTPGSSAGVGLNVVGSLRAPETDDAEILADEISGFVSSLLGLVGIAADPLSSRDHILLSNLLQYAWTRGEDLDLAKLLGMVQSPPMRRLGVIELETFFPAKDRMELLMRLNGLLASPTFASWSQGVELDIGSMLMDDKERPAVAVVSIGHLSEDERQFVVTLLLSKLVTWMRQQAGSSELRMLVYMDEVYGYAPPTAMPPSKRPILTLLKQARAFGVGLVLSTQNPVDLDYKAISNTGTWMVGRLQTERDRARLLDGMRSAAGETDVGELGSTIAGLAKREFVLHRTRASSPVVFTTRWAMSYLAGPLARNQIAQLMEQQSRSSSPPPQPSTGGSAQAGSEVPPSDDLPLDDPGTALAPEVHESIEVRYLDPAAAWSDVVSASAGSERLRAALVVRYRMLFDETSAKLRHTVEWEAAVSPVAEQLEPENVQVIDYDDRDLLEQAPSGASYLLGDAPLNSARWVQRMRRELIGHLYVTETLTLYRNPSLKVWSLPGETEPDFAARCEAVADEAMAAAADKLRTKLMVKFDRARLALAKAEDRAAELRTDLDVSQSDQIGDLAGAVLGSLFGGRSSGRSLGRRARSGRSRSAKTKQRLSSAENRVGEKADALNDLEDDARDAITELDELRTERAADIEEREIGLERNDISLVDLTLVWVPVASSIS
jgi:Helicase HerA, central domain